MKIAIQGISGCFHHEAVQKLYGKDITIVECHGFKDVFDSVNAGAADFGLVGIENSLQGSINQVYRLLARNSLVIVGEVRIKVEMYLIGSGAASFQYSDKLVAKVFSMNLALAQVEQWLDEHMPDAERIEYYDNAASVKHVVELDEAATYAIAGKTAAEEYGGKIIAGPINDDPNNYTRFFAVGPAATEVPNSNKTSIILTTDNSAGSLYRALGVLDEYEVSLSSLTSYPIAGDEQHYMFYIDYMAGLEHKMYKNILDDLKATGCSVRVLGSYNAA
jgi:prephenate dehydratase